MTIAAQIYSALVSADIPNVGSKVYKDLAPPSTPFPYITYADRLADRPALSGDSNILARNYLVQIDLWEKRQSENPVVIEAVLNLLETLAIEDDGKTIFRCRLFDTQRIVEFDDDNIHHAFSINVYRKV